MQAQETRISPGTGKDASPVEELQLQLNGLIKRLRPFLALEREIDGSRFEPLQILPHHHGLAAIDGSHRLLLDGRSFHILALRAGQVRYRGGLQDMSVAPLHLELVSQESLPRQFQELWEELTRELALPHQDRPRIELAAAAERLRELYEWQAAGQALSELEQGALLLLDGSLHTPSRHGQLVLEHLAERAASKGVAVVAVSKRSALSLRSMPLIPALERMSHTLCLQNGWAYPLHELVRVRSAGQVWAFCHGPHAPAFRVDIAGAVEPMEALSTMAYYCQDILYPGYPYPLAQVHNQVFLGAQEGRDLIQQLQSQALSQGLPTGAWQVLFADFHEVLDRSV